MKDNNIRRVYYSTVDGTITFQKVADMIPEHLSYGTLRSMENMTHKNRLLIFGIIIHKFDKKTKTIIYDTREQPIIDNG